MVGIVSDIVGIAAAAAVEQPFTAMAAEKVYGAKTALKLVHNADKVAAFASDFIGDICGTVSGALGITIIFNFMQLYPGYVNYEASFSVIITGLAAALTVTGKAGGKGFAINKYVVIILTVGKFLYSIENLIGITIFANNNKGYRRKFKEPRKK